MTIENWHPGRDRWLWPVTLTSESRRQIYFTEDGGSLNYATVPAGTYYVYAGTELSGYPSLLNELITQMNAAATEGTVFSVERATPARSHNQLYAGVRITATNAWTLHPVSLTPGDPSVQESIGHPLDGSVASISSSGSSNAITGWYTLRGELMMPEAATSKAYDRERIGVWSSEYVERDDAYPVHRGERYTRRVEVDFVQASHVYRHRALDPLHAEVGELAIGDTFNTLEDLWEYGLSKSRVILCHTDPSQPPTLGLDRYEVVACNSEEQRAQFGRLLRNMQVSGEYYEIGIDVVRVAGDYNG